MASIVCNAFGIHNPSGINSIRFQSAKDKRDSSRELCGSFFLFFFFDPKIENFRKEIRKKEKKIFKYFDSIRKELV